MSTINRRKFSQISAASVFAENLLVEGASFPLLAQAFQPATQRALEYSSLRTELERLEAMVTMPLPNWRVHVDDLPHAEDPSLDDSTWKGIKVGERWNERPAWFRRVVEIPKRVGAMIYMASGCCWGSGSACLAMVECGCF